ncbi:MAG TPA: hypothetical protein VNY31_05605 [Solirubrobacteraceae bacterium]|jgi:hypothetical protein|nr:hypothetical protein [Solirubrobacteraceae bacterium]
MFVVSALIYPCVLSLLCIGAGLLVDHVSGTWLPGMLLPIVGAATLIAVSQLSTYTVLAAPATPYALAIVAAAGIALGWARISALAHEWRRHRWQPAVLVLAYLVALAPVLAAGRPTFSSFGILDDSAFHLLGADYLIRHGQDYAHLDLRNSYGQYLNAYYATGYPSGADTLFGGSAFILGAPLIWTMQPFNAFMLASATGPMWLLVRRTGLAGGWCALATLTATVPALVYGYELVASVKEIVALGLILALGALVVLHPRWLRRGAAGAIPFATMLAGGVATLGVGFGAWALAAVLVLAAIAAGEIRAGRRRARESLGALALAAAIVLAGSLGTWTGLSRSVHVATGIASSTNPGNLHAPLHVAQVFGTWLTGSYANLPTGAHLPVSYAIVAITLLAAGLGALRVFYLGEYALLGWIALMIAVGLGLQVFAGTWVGAKALLITSPVIVLLAWSGFAALRHASGRWALRAAIPLALLLAGGIAVSDAMQYHSSNLAPTARYDELASVNARFAGHGPMLYGGFDEYALYQLRDLDVGGVDFMHPPAGIALMGGHGYPVDLDRVPASAWPAYPLVLTRRDPIASEPPSAYRLQWQGTYYQVWARRPGAPAAIAHLGLASTRPVRCAAVGGLARIAAARGAQLVAAVPPRRVTVALATGEHPRWRYTHPGLVLSGAGRLQTAFDLPYADAWNIWLKGQLMPAVSVSVDGRRVGSLGGQLDGNPHNPDALTPLRVGLAAGRHRLTIARGGFSLAPGDGGWAILHEIVLTPADAPDVDKLEVISPARWRTLCAGRFDWIEVVRG